MSHYERLTQLTQEGDAEAARRLMDEAERRADGERLERAARVVLDHAQVHGERTALLRALRVLVPDAARPTSLRQGNVEGVSPQALLELQSFASDIPIFLTSPYPARLEWDPARARLWSCDCAAHVLPLARATMPDDDAPSQAIEAGRLYALGLIGAELALHRSNEALESARRAADSAIDQARQRHRAELFAASWAARAASASARPGRRRLQPSQPRKTALAAVSSAGYAAALAVRSEAHQQAREAERVWQAQRLLEVLLGARAEV